MNGFSNFTILGTIGSDVQMTTLQNGTLRATFSVAVNQPYYDKGTDKWVERTTWFNLAQFGKRAEGAQKRLSKGLHALFSGIILSRIQEIDGKKYTMFVFQTDVVKPVTYGPRQGSDDNPQPARQGPQPSAPRGTPAPAAPHFDEAPGTPFDDSPVPDDELPF